MHHGGPTEEAPTNAIHIAASPSTVFEVLIDPRRYPEWLVGAKSIRSVDEDWPSEGSCFEHRIGLGPAQVLGSTTVRRCITDRELLISAGMGPLGEVAVRFRLEPTPTGTRVSVDEEPTRGAARAAWRLGRGAVAAALWGRNAVSLTGLRAVVLRSGHVG